MKRTAAILILFVLVLGFVSAQETKTKIYVKSTSIVKIYSHALGYKVLYTKHNMSLGEFYVPFSWIKAGGKAEIVWGAEPTYPYFSIFFKDGEFSFVRLYVQKNIIHQSWGILHSTKDLRGKFDVETLDLEY
jgi:hypothetical protein